MGCNADYYYSKKTRPNAAEKRELLARIHQIPGTEWYTIKSINSWFSGRQQADREYKRKESESRKKEKGGTASIRTCPALSGATARRG